VDKIDGLTVGADDYMTKPFNPAELMARVRSQLRRYTALGGMQTPDHMPQVYCTGGLMIDNATKLVTMDGEPVSLTPREYGILLFLTKHAGQVFSISQIYEAVWNEPAYNPENTVAVHIRRIREKIEINPKEPNYLKVVWGIGYKMEKLCPKPLG
jgi:DNA-binding response OmpR family regulator